MGGITRTLENRSAHGAPPAVCTTSDGSQKPFALFPVISNLSGVDPSSFPTRVPCSSALARSRAGGDERASRRVYGFPFTRGFT